MSRTLQGMKLESGIFDTETPGAFEWENEGKWLHYRCPCCGEHRLIPILPQTKGWQWDGNRDAPTLSPSILHLGGSDGAGCTWHGFLRAGVWVWA